MSEELRQIIHSAAVAGWWTVLLGAIWLTVAWLIWMGILKAKPSWLITLWGGNLEWKQVQQIMLTFMAVFKLILFVCILICIWLTLWAR